MIDARTIGIGCAVLLPMCIAVPAAHADNRRLNESVVANVYAAQHQAGCTNGVGVNPALRRAAQLHTDDLMNNRTLDGDIGSDGSTPQQRADAAGFRGTVAETVAINPSLAINNLDVLHQWYSDPRAVAIMQDCANTLMGVWSENSLDRSVLVAVYGHPA
ncbi:CAP domain-containing protein [Mycolicibacterium sphagni]|uniref:CAP domain-containing protein n=1 Tax=Mycolicibacterium sphagni TaxID=1786 RepID=UPI0021F2D283|nr:CAP domain-containing protein [Mycolicibacterium sphagni]MCV7177809.1 CAP domain-containing protein [Mycolicibacterium sphagni]